METRQPDRYGKGAITIRDLFRSSLRMRPDRIIIGEVRGGEALDMIQAMTSGQSGSMGTLHANSTYDALHRLETMALMSEVDLPLHALRAQISSGIDIIVQMNKQEDGKRLISNITEVHHLSDDGQYRMTDLFSITKQPQNDKEEPQNNEENIHEMQLRWTGMRSAFADELLPDTIAMVTEATEGIFASQPSE